MAGGAVAAEARIFPNDTPVRITNIAFPEDLSECLVYVANTSTKGNDGDSQRDVAEPSRLHGATRGPAALHGKLGRQRHLVVR